jgi:hypothetical protein
VTRWVAGGNVTAAQQKSVGLVILADLHFDTGTLYVHDAFGALTANGQSYLGLGQLGGIDVVNEDLSTVANSVVLTLSGVDPQYISDVMTEHIQGRVITLYVGLLDLNTLAWYANPEIVWEGRMDYPEITLDEGAATIKVTCEHRLMREPLVARYTDQDQQLQWPGDTFFNLLWQIPLATASWGAVNVTHPANQAPSSHSGYGGPATGMGPGFGSSRR